MSAAKEAKSTKVLVVGHPEPMYIEEALPEAGEGSEAVKCEPYDIGFVKGDLVTNVWDDGVGLVTDILWVRPRGWSAPHLGDSYLGRHWKGK